MKKRFLVVVLFMFALYSVSFQTSSFGIVDREVRTAKEQRFVPKREIMDNESSEQKVLQQRAELEEEAEDTAFYMGIEKIRPVVPSNYRCVVVKTKFRPQAARMSVDDGTSFIFS